MHLHCRPDTPDVSFSYTPRVVGSSGHSSMLSSESPDPAPNASSPFSSNPNMQTPSANPPPSSALNPFAAMAMMPASSTDLSEAESDAESVSTLRSSSDRQEPQHPRNSRAVPKSPKSPPRAHAQQPLDESECGKPLLAKLRMMERTHSAPGKVSLPLYFHAYSFKLCFS